MSDVSALWISVGAFAGAVAASTLVFGRRRQSILHLLLSGVVFNSFAAAVVTIIKTVVSPQKSQRMLFWLVGEIGAESWSAVTAFAGVTLACAAYYWRVSPDLDHCIQGDEVAHVAGIDVRRLRRGVYVALSLGIAATVSLTGLIGFVGLVIPHLVRARGLRTHRRLFAWTAVLGAVLVTTADAACRGLFVWLQSELPVGSLTALLGAPFFIWVARRRLDEGN